MGLKFLPVKLSDVQTLGDRPAMFLAYLRFISKFAGEDGYVCRSTSQIQNDLAYGRAVQRMCREVLVKSGSISLKLTSKRSPTISYKVNT